MKRRARPARGGLVIGLLAGGLLMACTRPNPVYHRRDLEGGTEDLDLAGEIRDLTGVVQDLASLCPSDMVLVTGGTFQMGAGASDIGITNPFMETVGRFCLDKTEVTVAAYAMCPMPGTC